MTTGLINPVETAQKAIRAGILTPARKHWPNEEFDYAPKVRLPSEAGLENKKFKTGKWGEPLSRRTIYKKRAPRTMRYVITKKDRPELFK